MHGYPLSCVETKCRVLGLSALRAQVASGFRTTTREGAGVLHGLTETAEGG
jgi:hypothetical protein